MSDYHLTLVDFQDMARGAIECVRKDLLEQKELRTVCFMNIPSKGLGQVYLPDVPPGVSPLEVIGEIVRDLQPDAVFFASEVWSSMADTNEEFQRDFAKHGGRVSQYEKKGEAVMILALTKQWQMHHIILFERIDEAGNVAIGAPAHKTKEICIIGEKNIGAYGEDRRIDGRVIDMVPTIAMPELPNKAEVGM